MTKKLLKEYEAPLCDVVEVSLESAVLTNSNGGLNNYVVGDKSEDDHSSNWGLN